MNNALYLSTGKIFELRIKDLVALLGSDVIEARGDMELTVGAVANDHRKAAEGALFVCVRGYVSDGHDFAQKALSNGASALVVQKPPSELKIGEGGEGGQKAAKAVIYVKDSRRALAAASSAFYRGPSASFKLVGVTGTKGKTTTVYMVHSIFCAAGFNTGLIGTVENIVGGISQKAKETTPESVDLQRLFSVMREKGADHVAMEVSSQGLALGRVAYCDFDVGVFTNFYKDHISTNEHRDLAEYMEAKLKLFTMCKTGVVNADMPEYPAVSDAVKNSGKCSRLLTYSARESRAGRAADVTADRIEQMRESGRIFTKFRVNTPWFSGDMTIPLPGLYNVYNALAAICACGACGVPEGAIVKGLANTNVRGRTQLIDEGQDFAVIVDYAHNAASLSALLCMLKGYDFSNITTVFGCGGDRARDRRFEMGEVSGELSDFTIITSDNPRSEPPAAILADIEQGVLRTKGRYTLIESRREAIGYAVKNAAPGDLVVIAGKGHETTQTFADRVEDFDDFDIARQFILERAKAQRHVHLPKGERS